MRKLAYSAPPVILLLMVCGWLWIISGSRTFQFFGKIVPRVETSQPVVALTFDDGPSPDFTREVLKILADENVKGTFFLIGSDLEKHPAEGAAIASGGHEIGNHSFSHSRMRFVAPSFVKEEIERTDSLIRATGYDRTIHFRPPYGKKLFSLPYYLSQDNRVTITWDVEPESYPDIASDPAEITKHVLANATRGSIILLHVMYDRDRKSMKSVKPIIRGLKEKGFQFVTVSELIGLK